MVPLIIAQVHENLRNEQASRSEEQRTHAEMLKELQGLIASERESSNTLKRRVREVCTYVGTHSLREGG